MVTFPAGRSCSRVHRSPKESTLTIVRYGMLGLGDIAHRFAHVLTKTAGVKLTAVASRDQARSDAFAAQYGAARAYASYDQLIADPEVDILYISLTHNFHREVVRKCLEAGKAVLCEKPLVLHGADAAELIALSRKTGTLLMEAMWTRCLPAFQKAREWVAGGLIGTVALVEASFAFHIPYRPEHRLFRPELAGGALYDAGVYPIEFAIGVLDEAPGKAVGLSTPAPSGVDQFFSLALAFPSGALASLSCGFQATTDRNARVSGSAGRVVVYDFLGAQKAERFDAEGRSVEVFEAPHDDGFVYEILHAADLFRQGKTESPLIPHRDSLACARVFDELLG